MTHALREDMLIAYTRRLGRLQIEKKPDALHFSTIYSLMTLKQCIIITACLCATTLIIMFKIILQRSSNLFLYPDSFSEIELLKEKFRVQSRDLKCSDPGLS